MNPAFNMMAQQQMMQSMMMQQQWQAARMQQQQFAPNNNGGQNSNQSSGSPILNALLGIANGVMQYAQQRNVMSTVMSMNKFPSMSMFSQPYANNFGLNTSGFGANIGFGTFNNPGMNTGFPSSYGMNTGFPINNNPWMNNGATGFPFG